MAQLRAKQIKLAAADDLLIGGANGNGTVLSKGTAGQVLKVLAGGALGYEKAAAADTTFTGEGITATDVQAAIIEVAGLVEAEETRATGAEEALQTAIDDVAADLTTEVTDRTAADTAIQTELDATQAGAGLSAAGAYTSETTSNYINAATTLKGADMLLDAAIKAVADDLAELTGGEGVSLATLQDELDAVETAVGLTAAGEFDATKNAGSTHTGVAAATSVMDTVMAVDAALASAEAAIDTRIDTVESDATALEARVDTAEADITALETALADEVTRATDAEADLQAELDATQATVGTATDGAPVFYANGNYIVQGAAEDATDPENVIPAVTPDNHRVAIGKLDAALKAEEVARGTAVSTLQSEVDATQAGAGLEVTGAYVAPVGSNYLGSATTLKGADVALDTAIKAVADSVTALENGSVGALGDEVDAIESAIGLNTDGTLAAFATGGHAEGKTTYKAAVEAIDAALVTAEADIVALQDAVQAATNLDALVFKGVITGATNQAALEAIEATAEEGDVYRIGSTGAESFADQGFDVNVGDFVAYIGLVTEGEEQVGKWVKFDNTDPVVSAAGGETALVVSGNTYSGFELSITKDDIESASDAIVITGGTGAAFANVSFDLDASKINFADLAGAGAPGVATDGMFLKWDDTAGAIVYVTAAELGATVAVEEDFTPAAAANVSFTLTNAPVGDIAVYMNGVKLKKAGFSVTGSTVTLVDATNGYPYETGDVLSVSYNKAA